MAGLSALCDSVSLCPAVDVPMDSRFRRQDSDVDLRRVRFEKHDLILFRCVENVMAISEDGVVFCVPKTEMVHFSDTDALVYLSDFQQRHS